MAKRDRHNPNLPAPWRQRSLLRRLPPGHQLPENEGGVNMEPGSDDGWREPTPVRLSDNSTVQLLKDGQALKHAFEAIKNAKKRVCLEFYIWDADETGHAFADLLSAKARQGLKVFVIYDSFGTLRHDRSMFANMRTAGVRTAEFHPVRPWESRRVWRPFNRDHRKICCVDDDFASVGGMNIANNYAGSWVVKNDLDPSMLWRDTGVAVHGPAARMFIESFAKTWHYIRRGGKLKRTEYAGRIHRPSTKKGKRLGKPSRPELTPDPPTPGQLIDGPIGLLATAPTLSSPLRPIMHSLLACAKTSIRMTMAYFAPDDQLIDELCAAARRGVKVSLMFGAKSDMPIMVTAARAFYAKLLDAGVRIYERQWVIVHAKTVVIDDEYALIGSTNLDYRSIEFNLEVSAIVRNQHFARQLRALFAHDMRFAVEVERNKWKKRPTGDRLIQWLVSRMRYLL